MKYYISSDQGEYTYFKEYIDILRIHIKPEPLFIYHEQIETYKGDDTTFICVHYIPESLKEYPHTNLILVNTEQLSREDEVQRICYKTSNDIKIIDYSMANIDILMKHGKQRHLIHYIPYSPMFNEIFNYEKIHDACIISSCSRRRNLFINQFQNVKIISGWYSDRDDLLFRHKILVNIHSEDDRTIFESIRCNRCIFNKMIVITEKSNEERIHPLKKYMIECDLSEIPMMINKVLNNYDEYYNTLFKDFDLTNITQELKKCGEYSILQNNKKTTSGDDVTLCITSCNRAYLLDKTLESFVKYNTYPIKETYIIDDSGKVGCNDEVIAKYKDILNIKPIYNEKNIGQIESIDKMYSYVTTPWIFHCEEDWEFLQPGFIEKSMKIFNDNPDDSIFTVWLRPHNDTNGHPIEYDSLNRGYYKMSRQFSYMWDDKLITWAGITFNPGLRRTSTCLKHHPYSEKCEKFYRKGAYHADEYTINDKYRLDGYYSCILDDPSGHVKHIGNGHHVHRDGFD